MALPAVAVKALQAALKTKRGRRILAVTVVALILGAVLAVMSALGILATIIGGGEDIEPADGVITSEDGTEGRVPWEVYDLALAASRQSTVPWTIYAAIAEIATDYGENSPYDRYQRRSKQKEDPIQEGTPEEEKQLWYPTVNPPIGGENNKQGLGPLLIWPELAAEYPDLDPQNWGEAMEIVAQELTRLIEETEASGRRRPKPPVDEAENAEAAGDEIETSGEERQRRIYSGAAIVGSTEYDQWWIGILDQLRAGRDPEETSTVNCGIDDSTTVAQAVSVIFRCAITETGGAYAVTGTKQGAAEIQQRVDPTQLTWVDGLEAREQIVEDAVSLVYNWVGDDLWRKPVKTVVGPGCHTNTDDSGAAADAPVKPQRQGWRGVFPLSDETAAAAGVEVKCNTVEALRKVAAKVAAGASIRPSERDPQSALFDGWEWHHLAVGDDDAKKRHAKALAERTALPTQPSAARSEACFHAWDLYFWGSDDGGQSFVGALAATAHLADDLPVDEVASYTLMDEVASGLYQRNPNGMPDVASKLRTARERAGVAEACGYAAMTNQEAAAELMRAGEQEALGWSLENFNLASEGASAVNASGLQIWYRYEQLVEAGGTEHKWYEHAAVARFADSTVRKALTHPEPEPTPSPTVRSTGFGQKVASLAVALGGLYSDDPRRGAEILGTTFILALETDPSCGPRETATSCDWAPDGSRGGGPYDYMAYDAASGKQKADQGLFVPIGAFATTERCQQVGAGPFDEWRYTAAPMAHHFARMCDAAAEDGVHLSGASIRFYKTQEEMYYSRGCHRGPCAGAATAPPGRSYHQWGLAIDINLTAGVYDWMHAIVGCYSGPTDRSSPDAVYRPLPAPVSPDDYVKDPPCGSDEIPVKRANTFGLVFGVGCDAKQPMTTTRIVCPGGNHEPWHVEIGIPLIVEQPGIGGAMLDAQSAEECYYQARQLPVGPGAKDKYDTNMVATVVYAMFECILRNSGLAQVPPTKNDVWDGAATWGFSNFAEQAAAEAVVVSYCESVGYADHAIEGNNPWGYGGVFQFGDREFRAWVKASGGMIKNKFDPYDNIWAGAMYFLSAYNSNNLGGWGPWAVVNTKYGGPNVHVKVPILPRFKSVRAGYVGEPGPELPVWAAKFGTVPVPEYVGCPYTDRGLKWPGS